ncbi:PH domain-containing protein [Bacteroides acidifaciens]|uniref:PH domain-containing protein n=1 Tax=Bacteroides acidifaciens TaxID=85831 RepID=UPI00242E6986|nr:PH domain-containing protein [Bacteroides acidifaciens]
MELFHKYKCIPSKYVKIATILVSINIFLFSILSISLLIKAPTLNAWIGNLLFISVLLVYLRTCAFYPRYISLSKESLVLKCLFTTKSFKYQDIDYIKKGFKVRGIRRFGSNGVWGYIGIIDADNKYHTLFNNEKQIIEFSYRNKVYLISCEQYEEVIKEVDKLIVSQSKKY